MIKQTHNQLCLLAGKRVVLLEQTSSTPPAPPSRLMGLLFKVLKDWSRREKCKDKLTSPPSRFFHNDFKINFRGLFKTLISCSCFIKDLGILHSQKGYHPSHQLFKFYSKCKSRSVPKGIFYRINTALGAGIQSLISLVPFYGHNNFHTPTKSNVTSRVPMVKRMLFLHPIPLIGFNIKPCHLN